jgi:hypothetical protein
MARSIVQGEGLLSQTLDRYLAILLLYLNSNRSSTERLGGNKRRAAAHERVEDEVVRLRCLAHKPPSPPNRLGAGMPIWLRGLGVEVVMHL